MIIDDIDETYEQNFRYFLVILAKIEVRDSDQTLLEQIINVKNRNNLNEFYYPNSFFWNICVCQHMAVLDSSLQFDEEY